MIKNPLSNAGDLRDKVLIPIPGSGRSPGGGHGNSLPGKSHEERGLVDCSLWGSQGVGHD